MTETESDLLADEVLGNLNHQQLWTSLQKVQVSVYSESLDLVTGIPGEKLHPDDPEPIHREWVLPVATQHTYSVKKLAGVFDGIQKNDPKAKRLVMAMVTNDSTVVYYIVNDGLVKPRRN